MCGFIRNGSGAGAEGRSDWQEAAQSRAGADVGMMGTPPGTGRHCHHNRTGVRCPEQWGSPARVILQPAPLRLLYRYCHYGSHATGHSCAGRLGSSAEMPVGPSRSDGSCSSAEMPDCFPALDVHLPGWFSPPTRCVKIGQNWATTRAPGERQRTRKRRCGHDLTSTPTAPAAGVRETAVRRWGFGQTGQQ